MRLLLISLGTLVITLLVGLIVRFWGLSLPYKQFEHPYFNFTKMTTPPASILVFNKANFEYTADKLELKFPDIKFYLVWLNIYMTSDRQLISDYNFDVDAFQTWTRDKKKFKGKFIHNYSLTEIKEFYSEILPLDKALILFPTQQFVFNILTNDTDIHKDIINFIEKQKIEDRVLINSPVDIVIKAIKEQKPMWVYGTSIPEAARLKSFATLNLESAITIRGDVFIAPISYLNRPLVDAAMVAEMKRRKKYVFLGPMNTQEEKRLAEELKPDGIVY